MTPENAALMAEYNRWMNERVFASAARLDPAELMLDKGAFFGSIFGTLNHIAVADTIWLHRFALHPAGFQALAGLVELPLPTSLRQMLVDDLAGLLVYRRRLDALISNWAGELTAGHLSSSLDYTNMAGESKSKRFAALVQHLFNHQTHHRGQVSTLLLQSGVDIGVTDLLAVIPDGGA